jgi:hypothetical protein
MRPLAEYSWRDWQLFRPLTHCYKTMRYAAGGDKRRAVKQLIAAPLNASGAA